jgi:sulfur carrier protein
MVRVNDKFDLEWEEGLTVETLLQELKFSFPLIVVSVDGEMVARDQYATHEIPDGAQVKVLHMTAGG